MTHAEIIAAIDGYAARSGLAPSTVCQYALKNRLVYDRLKTGGSCSVKTVERLLGWMHDNPPSSDAATEAAE